jgi:hypothetical protein
MKIELSKRLSGKELEKYVSDGLVHYGLDQERIFSKQMHFQTLNYDFSRLGNDLIGKLAENFNAAGIEARPSGHNLWSSFPQAFALAINLSRPFDSSTEGFKDDSSYYEEIGRVAERVEDKVITKRGLFGKKMIREAVYREIPRVDVSGGIVFEGVSGIEPTPILQVLTNLGYSGKVITTPEQIEVIMKKIEEERNNRIQNYPHSCARSNSGESHDNTGTVIGAFVGGLEGGIGGAVIGGAIGSLFND